MLIEEQTVVLLGRTTRFTTVCEACVEEQLAELLDESMMGASLSGSLELEHDHGWSDLCAGHRVRVIRAGRSAEHVLH